MVAKGEQSEVTVPVERFTSGMFPWHKEALAAFDNGKARFASLMCHRRSRKTTLALNLMIRECCANPRHLYRYIAPTRVEARDIVWNDPFMLFGHLPDKRKIPWRAVKSELSVYWPNGSILKLEGANKITKTHRGKACNGAVFDEWSQHENPDIWPEIFRPMIAEGADRWAWFLWTPKGLNHAVEQYRKWERQSKAAEYGDLYVKTLAAYGPNASGIMSPKELARALADMPDALGRQEFGCEILVSTDMILIQPYVIERLLNIHHGWPEERRIISCDPGFGGDECVLMAWVNTEVIDMQIMHPSSTGEVVGALNVLGQKYDISNYIIDNIGVGQGVIDGMRENPDYHVQDFDARKKSEFLTCGGNVKTFNRRAEGWWYLWEQMRDGKVEYPHDIKTRTQLSNVCYKLKTDGAVAMELKENVRKRIGSSPDRADCYVAGHWGLKNVDPYTGRREIIPADYGTNATRERSWQAA